MRNLFFNMFLSFCLFYSGTSFAELSLSDLSFKDEQIKVDPKLLSVMEERQSKLQTHQKLGLATVALMTTTLLLADKAKDNNLHMYGGIATGLLYWTTAYYTWSAPKPDGIKSSGSTEIHKTLAWIHVPLMAITPILGYLAKQDANKGKESKGIVKAHGDLASAAFISFMAAGLTMYFDF